MTILLNKPVGYVSGQPEPGLSARGRPVNQNLGSAEIKRAGISIQRI